MTGTKSTRELGMSAVDRITILQATCLNSAIRRASRRLGQLYDEALKPIGLRATQFAVLAEIERISDGEDRRGPGLQALARALMLQVSAMTYALRPLVRDELVEIKPDLEDGRAKRVRLTARGRARLRKGILLWDLVNKQMETTLGAPSTKELHRISEAIVSPKFTKTFRSKASKIRKAS